MLMIVRSSASELAKLYVSGITTKTITSKMKKQVQTEKKVKSHGFLHGGRLHKPIIRFEKS